MSISKQFLESLWKGLREDWEKTQYDDNTLKKACAVFNAFLAQTQPGVWDMTINDKDGEVLGLFPLCGTKDEVCKMADALIGEFLEEGFKHVHGWGFDTTRPANEIRFKQITGINPDLVGLTEDGIVYVRRRDQWAPLNMLRDDPKKR